MTGGIDYKYIYFVEIFWSIQFLIWLYKKEKNQDFISGNIT